MNSNTDITPNLPQPPLWEMAVNPAVDILMFVAFFTLTDRLTNLFTSHSMANLVLIPAIYLAMCGGIILSKYLQWYPGSNQKPSGLVSGTAWFFSVFVIVMALDTAGVFEKGSSAGAALDGTMNNSSFQILMVIAYLFILVLFPLIILKTPKPMIPFGTLRHAFLKLVVILLINSMSLITAVYWEWQMLDAEPMEVAWTGKALIFCVSFPVFLLFYAPPRLALLNLERSRWSLSIYLIFLGFLVWRLMGG